MATAECKSGCKGLKPEEREKALEIAGTYDSETLKRYRKLIDGREGNFVFVNLEDREFISVPVKCAICVISVICFRRLNPQRREPVSDWNDV